MWLYGEDLEFNSVSWEVATVIWIIIILCFMFHGNNGYNKDK